MYILFSLSVSLTGESESFAHFPCHCTSLNERALFRSLSLLLPRGLHNESESARHGAGITKKIRVQGPS